MPQALRQRPSLREAAPTTPPFGYAQAKLRLNSVQVPNARSPMPDPQH
ncbi:hypothetical protein [Nostoc sp.]